MRDIDRQRHTKIVGTMGPASRSLDVVEGMLTGGMNIARFNLAYGTLDEHIQVISEVRSVSRQLNLTTGVLLDMPGSKHGTGSVRDVFQYHLEFAISQNADFIALSYISSAQQVVAVRGLLQEMKTNIPLVAKIERAQALENSAAILDVCDNIMVARGDLANEISIEKVPMAQKRLISEANRRGKPVITATQMLESMVKSATPTRAEATDVANAVLDGSDALMLSEETAIGNYPVAAVEMMAGITLETESMLPYDQILRERGLDFLPEADDATARAACQMAHQVHARAIVAFTTGGTTALRVSKYRPRQPILAVTPVEAVMRRLTIAWGVFPVKKPEPLDLEGVFEQAREVAIETGAAHSGDLVVITAGIPLTVSGSTNLVKVQQV